MSKIAAILIRSLLDINKDIKDTLLMLNLNKKHSAVILNDTEVIRGMLTKCEGYVTFGIISEETEKILTEIKGTEKSARLHPPRGGFERKGIKLNVARGGALGLRTNMDDLVKRMLK